MERCVRYCAGGTLGLLELLREHREEVEYLLIKHGLRLRDCPSPGFNWRDLWVIVRHDPEIRDLVQPLEDRGWGLAEQLSAMAVDSLAWLVWAKTKDAEKGRNKPKPIPRPGVVDDSAKQIGTAAPVEEILALMP